MYKKILVPVDGSESSLKALKTAGKLAALSGGSVILLHVSAYDTVEQVGFFGIGYTALPSVGREGRREVAKRTLQELQDAAKKHLPKDTKWTAFVDFGHPGELIEDYAKSKKADLIVMGSRGMGLAREILLGSVSHYVVQHASTPVLILKDDTKVPKAAPKKKPAAKKK